MILQWLLWLKFQWKQTNWTNLSIVRLNKSIMPKKLANFFIAQNDKDDQNYWLTWLFEMTKITQTTNWREKKNDFKYNFLFNISTLNYGKFVIILLQNEYICVWWIGFVIWCHGNNMLKLCFESSLPWPQSKAFTTQPPHHVVI